MLRALKSSIDYCLFTFGFILALQLPEFIQQYQQYMAGKLSEANWHLKSYQHIADQRYDGSIIVLVNEYIKNDSPAIRQTGELVSQLVNRVDILSMHVTTLNNETYINKLWFFISNVQVQDAKTVMSYYQLAIPLTVEALISGVVLAFVFVWLRLIATAVVYRIFGISPKPHSYS